MKKLILFLISLLLAGCVGQPVAPTATSSVPIFSFPPTKLLSPVPTHRLLPTSVPATLAFHQWVSGPVLAQIHEGAGYTEPATAWMIMPSVVVYADGRIIAIQNDESVSKNVWHGTIKETHISPDAVCSLLIKIDASGFFDFKQSDYVAPNIMDAGSTNIIVNAWRSNSIGAYSFASATDPPAALVISSSLLSSYRAYATTPYQMERAMLLVVERQVSKRLDDAYAWPATLPRLKKLVTNPDDSSTAILTGQNMLDAYKFLDRIPFLAYVRDDGIEYLVLLRPLLPFELSTQAQGWSPPSSFAESPKVDLTCGINTP